MFYLTTHSTHFIYGFMASVENLTAVDILILEEFSFSGGWWWCWGGG